MALDPEDLGREVLEEFAERASRSVDHHERGSFSVQAGGPTAPPARSGADVGNARLTTEQALSLRTTDETVNTAAARLQVSPRTVRHVKNGETYKNARPRCPACGEDQNWPNLPTVPGCRPGCPTYGRRTPSPQPPPFAPEPIPPPKPAPKGKGESGHQWHDAAPMLARVQAWQALEVAVNAWRQSRDVAARGVASPLALLRIESEIEIAARRLDALRKANR